jgi:hypothetical protein
MTHELIECTGKRGEYVAGCQCGERFEAGYLSDLIYEHRIHRYKAAEIDNTNVISIFTKRPLLV